MDVLLINPPHRLYEPYEYQLLMPPLNLTIVAAVLRNYGIESHILDMPILSLGPADLMPLLKQWKPRVIGIANRSTYSWPIVKQIAYIAKKYSDRVPIVSGGTFVSWCPDIALSLDSPIDTVVVGESELTVPQIFQRLLKSDPLDGLAGVAFRRDDKIVQGERAPVLDDLDKLPMPANNLLPIDKYIKRGEMYLTFLGRGCPFSCDYCTSSWEKRVRHRSVVHVMQEVTQAYEYGFRRFYFCDDIFTLKRELVVHLCESIRQDFTNITWQCMSRIENVDEDILRAMASAGCRTIAFGFENLSQEVLGKMGRTNKQEYAQTKKVFDLCWSLNIRPVLFLMFGMPSSVLKDELETIRIATKLNPYDVRDFSFMPYPGTKFYEHPNDHGIHIHEKRFERWSQLDSPVHETNHLSQKEMIESRIICGALFRYGHTFASGRLYRRCEDSVLVRTKEGGFIYNPCRPESKRKTDMFMNCLELTPFYFEILLHCDGYHSVDDLVDIAVKLFAMSSEEALSKVETVIEDGLSFEVIKESVDFVEPGFSKHSKSLVGEFYSETGV